MASFRGIFESTLDDKRRFKLPKKLRDTVPASENFIIQRGYDGCLFLYPEHEWGKQEEKLKRLNSERKEDRFLERVKVAYSEHLIIDGMGRVTIPPRLLEFAQITKEVLILGVLSRIELWAPQVYQKYMEEQKQSPEEIAERVYGS